MNEQEMNITSVIYNFDIDMDMNVSIQATIDGVEMSVPLCEGNRHFDEITRQVAEGTLTIEEAQ